MTIPRADTYPGPLSGIKVIECGRGVSAAYAARLLAELGADVVKVESPDGDVTRRSGPFAGDPDPEASGLFHVLNFEKRGVALDVEEPHDRAALENLLATADIYVTNEPLTIRRQHALDGHSVISRHSSLVAVAVSPFGDEGPYGGAAGAALTSSAFGGSSWLIGEQGRPPLALPYDLPDYFAGASAAAASLAAILARFRTGRGQIVDVAASDVVASFNSISATIIVDYGRPWRREGRRAAGSAGAYPYAIFPCKDGFIAIIGRNERDWQNILTAMGNPQWADDEAFQDPFKISLERPDEADVRMIAWLSQYTKAELREIADTYNLALAPVRTMTEVLAEPQSLHRGLFAEPLDVGGAELTPPLGPWLTARGRPRRIRRAPRLGEHNTEVLAQ